jgi:hypothetical protein
MQDGPFHLCCECTQPPVQAERLALQSALPALLARLNLWNVVDAADGYDAGLSDADESLARSTDGSSSNGSSGADSSE